jgi:hypothetical protein
MLFWKEHKDDTECMHCGKSRYVKVRNEDGISVTTKVATKQLRYIPITPRLKRLFLSEETTKQMRWHHEGKRESEDPDIMSHPADSEAWQTLDRFDPAHQPRHCIRASHPGPGQWTPLMPWGTPSMPRGPPIGGLG